MQDLEYHRFLCICQLLSHHVHFIFMNVSFPLLEVTSYGKRFLFSLHLCLAKHECGIGIHFKFAFSWISNRPRSLLQCVHNNFWARGIQFSTCTPSAHSIKHEIDLE